MADSSDTRHDLPPVTGSGEHATVTLLDYLLAVRAGDRAAAEERDRRYAEVKAAEEKALRVKETADHEALQLARDQQTYKDTLADKLRDQIASERGLYATKTDIETLAGIHRSDITSLREYFDALHRPVVEFIAGQQRADTVKRLDTGTLIQAAAVIVAIAAVLFAILKK